MMANEDNTKGFEKTVEFKYKYQEKKDIFLFEDVIHYFPTRLKLNIIDKLFPFHWVAYCYSTNTGQFGSLRHKEGTRKA